MITHSKKPVLLVIGTSIDPHIAAVLNHLDSEVEVVRFDVDRFPIELKLNQVFGGNKNSVIMSFRDNKRLLEIDVSCVNCVWFRRLGSPVVSEEIAEKYSGFCIAEAEHALMGYLSTLPQSIFINEMWSVKKACYKPFQYLLASKHGLSVPDGIITNDTETAFEWLSNIGVEVVAKTLSAPIITRKGFEREFAFTNKVPNIDISKDNLSAVNFTSTQFQRLIDPIYEVRVNTVGKINHAVRIDVESSGGSVRDWRSGQINCSYSWYDLPKIISDRLIAFLAELNVDFAASDFVVDRSGRHYFLESNPHGAWLWLENALSEHKISKELANHILYTTLQNFAGLQ